MVDELRDRSSILNYYRALIKLRRHRQALLSGDYLPVNENDQNVLSYVRQSSGNRILVLLNMSKNPQTVSFTGQLSSSDSVSSKHSKSTETALRAKVLLSSVAPGRKISDLSAIELKPYESLILEIF